MSVIRLLLSLAIFNVTMAAPAEHAEPALESQTRDLLSHHEFIATLGGIQHRPCRFLTSLCPDRCNHAATVAVFNVTDYEAYQKLGQYGDERQTVWHVALDDKLSAELTAAIRALEVGARVRIVYDHEYVTNTWVGGGQAKFPERPLRSIERV